MQERLDASYVTDLQDLSVLTSSLLPSDVCQASEATHVELSSTTLIPYCMAHLYPIFINFRWSKMLWSELSPNLLNQYLHFRR